MKLLTIGNAKTTKGEDLGILTGILYLSPEVSDKLCPYASQHCKALCLVNSGLADIIPRVNQARAHKTREFLADKTSFTRALEKDILALERKAMREGMKPAVRLNGTSDILWERLIDFTRFPNVQFYDYTKIPTRFRKLAPNYHLTFSFSGENWNECNQALSEGFNVAVVFNGTMPRKYKGHRVIDGTAHDVRFLDGKRRVIVGLCPKGNRARRAAKIGNPFIVNA